MCLKGQRRSSNQKKRICSRISLHSREKKKHNHYAITKPCVCPSPRRERASESNKRKKPKVLLLPLTFHPRQYENNTKGIKHNQAPFPPVIIHRQVKPNHQLRDSSHHTTPPARSRRSRRRRPPSRPAALGIARCPQRVFRNGRVPAVGSWRRR